MTARPLRSNALSLALPWLSLLVACRSPGLDGADSVRPAEAPRGRRIAQYVPERCRDARRSPTPAPALVVERVALENGRELLIETRPGFDSLVATLGFDDGDDWVFQFTTDDAKTKVLLHEFRVKKALRAGGRLRVADEFEESSGSPQPKFRATSVALDCALVPSAAVERLDTLASLE